MEENIEYIKDALESPKIVHQVQAIAAFLGLFLLIRTLISGQVNKLGGEHVLDMSALNFSTVVKEVFLAYLNAALLEPVIAIAGMDLSEHQQLAINLLTLGSICWWTWIVTDAFDFFDITQQYMYGSFREEIMKEPKRYEWMRISHQLEKAKKAKKKVIGSFGRDISLWFLLACIGAAWMPGAISHRDVLHAYAIVFMWIFLHHSCRQATSWGSGYIVTFLFPSAALMPLEYCLPLMDVADTVEDLEWVEGYRNWLKERTGVELVIES